MKKIFVCAACLLVTLLGSTVQAQKFVVTGTGVPDGPADTVHVLLDYDTSFSAIAEDLLFELQFAGITFMPLATAGSKRPGGNAPRQSLTQYLRASRQFPAAHQGGYQVNPMMPGSAADYAG